MSDKTKPEGKLSVLFATRDDFLQDTVLEVLEEKNYKVVVVNSCKKVFEALLDYDFDFVIFDPDVEGLSGLDAIQLIKKMVAKLPLIIVSDESSYESGVKIAKAGVLFRLGKPIEQSIAKQLFESLEKTAIKS